MSDFGSVVKKFFVGIGIGFLFVFKWIWILLKIIFVFGKHNPLLLSSIFMYLLGLFSAVAIFIMLNMGGHNVEIYGAVSAFCVFSSIGLILHIVERFILVKNRKNDVDSKDKSTLSSDVTKVISLKTNKEIERNELKDKIKDSDSRVSEYIIKKDDLNK